MKTYKDLTDYEKEVLKEMTLIFPKETEESLLEEPVSKKGQGCIKSCQDRNFSPRLTAEVILEVVN